MTSPYVIESGLRKVVPYYHVFETFVKGRWVGRSPIEVFTEEFQEADERVHIKKIENGTMKIIRNSTMPSIPTEIISGTSLYTTKLIHNDLLVDEQHCHEPSVSSGEDIFDLDPRDRSIPIIFENDELLVVNKPSGTPVHPTGRYYYNSLTEIVKHDLKLSTLHPCHRLDKLTSGVLLLAKTKESASKYGKLILDKSVEKEYLARVVGKFPNHTITCKDPVFGVNTKYGVMLNLPKEAESIFTKIKYIESLNQSLVLCKPITGRTHQLRIHLRNLGHPIVNDSVYGPKSSKPRNDVELKIRARILQNESYDDILSELHELKNEYSSKIDKSLNGEKCPDCNKELYVDTILEDTVIWLHAKKYSAKDKSWVYESEYPKWCNI